MDFDLDKTNTKPEAENCDVVARLQDDSLNCSLIEKTKSADSLPSISISEKEQDKAATADENAELEMSGRRHHYPASYRYPELPPSSSTGARYEVQGGKVVLHR